MRVKKSERKQLKAWSNDCRAKANNQCQYCGLLHGSINSKGNKVYLQSHHLLKLHSLRFDPLNACCLCPSHHRFSSVFSAHNNPLAFAHWFISSYPAQWSNLLQFIETTLTHKK